MFTDDQRAIMRNNLNISNRRGYLLTSTNASNTGIAANALLPCAPQANFKANELRSVKDQQFSSQTSTFGNPISWQWNFPGGSPSSSTSENPSITYNYQEITTFNWL